jgi:dual specificity tyrosine-phosphorylation-regulated kinase 2/3/4
MKNYENPWSVDMWSLGCVLLEIIVGVPLWMSLPLLVPNKVGKSFLQKEGLFAVKGRLFPEIIAKQREVVSRLSSVIDKENYSKIVISPKMKKVLKGML